MSILLTACAWFAMPQLPPFQPAPREFRGAWVATVDNIDWPSKKTLTTKQQQDELKKIFSVAEQAGLNAIILQVRPSCDAIYPSKLEPWTEYLTGQQGKAPEPIWDPLEWAIAEAHARGIELHAWFNPYRAKHFVATGPLAPNHVSFEKPAITKKYGRYLWLDPGEPETQRRTLDVILDTVKRYDLDGIHLDDYFYPYAESDSAGKKIPFPDEASFAAYQASGGMLGKKDWRRKNVNDFIEKLYESVKSAKPWVKVGISPFGIARPNQPEGVVAGIDQYDDPLYADCKLWFEKGWCDYFTPQLYWPIESNGQPYGKLLNWWAEQNKMRRHLWPGNYTSRMVPGVGDWKFAEIERQIELTRKSSRESGNVHFSFKVFLKNEQSIVTQLGQGLYKSKAIIPSSAWITSPKPIQPAVTVKRDSGAVELKWLANATARQWAVYQLQAGTWTLTDLMPRGTTEILFAEDAIEQIEAFAVSCLNASGIESEPTIVRAR